MYQSSTPGKGYLEKVTSQSPQKENRSCALPRKKVWNWSRATKNRPNKSYLCARTLRWSGRIACPGRPGAWADCNRGGRVKACIVYGNACWEPSLKSTVITVNNLSIGRCTFVKMHVKMWNEASNAAYWVNNNNQTSRGRRSWTAQQVLITSARSMTLSSQCTCHLRVQKVGSQFLTTDILCTRGSVFSNLQWENTVLPH